ncbi:MAG: hypothetical protein AUJ92_12860 [Armatimonadetes bacterium CG2_30_59_28]|nr:MAG: hypothetical protein AUJ92_12860 [Armatimonadetes bacterium CG2_30_59_28]PIU60667.1 MAG: hypothetical protein COS85_23275 [Armatimonadetes bacterium CG07_land_8_20_14_0_80_59_28]PIY41855.1 MAG: hypothetical protein COZ05_15055 [Armatimonadetes bacterium CG_4_10_14_3_um_filter_59_10]
MQYVTDSRRKLIWFPRTNATHFFDLEADPGECHNLIEDTSRGDEVKLWHGCLIAELEARDCGWVKDGELIPPDEGVPLVSPYRDRKWLGE